MCSFQVVLSSTAMVSVCRCQRLGAHTSDPMLWCHIFHSGTTGVGIIFAFLTNSNMAVGVWFCDGLHLPMGAIELWKMKCERSETVFIRLSWFWTPLSIGNMVQHEYDERQNLLETISHYAHWLVFVVCSAESDVSSRMVWVYCLVSWSLHFLSCVLMRVCLRHFVTNASPIVPHYLLFSTTVADHLDPYTNIRAKWSKARTPTRRKWKYFSFATGFHWVCDSILEIHSRSCEWAVEECHYLEELFLLWEGGSTKQWRYVTPGADIAIEDSGWIPGFSSHYCASVARALLRFLPSSRNGWGARVSTHIDVQNYSTNFQQTRAYRRPMFHGTTKFGDVIDRHSIRAHRSCVD